ncbi:DsbA family protein [Nocardia camponoti]|uniref:DsbA family protein n=1 Tax=Nocardia camponoti TaxID=1616106 RepID=UPI00166E9D45|nr:thioredoxin domain-containing protein [Nocardia camponoti]
MSTAGSPHTPRPVSSRTTYALAAVALVLIGLVVAFWLIAGRHDPVAVRDDGYGNVHNTAVVSSVQPDGVIRVGKPDAAVTIEMFEDPLCPACGALERVYGQEIAKKMDEGKLAVNYHLLTFLDPQSKSKDYSTRASAANLCVAQGGSGPVYSAFHSTLFTTKQPEEGGAPDLDNAALAAIAKESGAPESVATCITSGAQLATAKAADHSGQQDLSKRLDGQVATPSVFQGTTRIDTKDENWVNKVAP